MKLKKITYKMSCEKDGRENITKRAFGWKSPSRNMTDRRKCDYDDDGYYDSLRSLFATFTFEDVCIYMCVCVCVCMCMCGF